MKEPPWTTCLVPFPFQSWSLPSLKHWGFYIWREAKDLNNSLLLLRGGESSLTRCRKEEIRQEKIRKYGWRALQSPLRASVKYCRIFFFFFFKVRGVYLQTDLVCALPYCKVILEMASSIEGSCHIQSASAIAKGFQTGKRKFNKLLLYETSSDGLKRLMSLWQNRNTCLILIFGYERTAHLFLHNRIYFLIDIYTMSC